MLDNLLGNAAEVDPKQTTEELADVLIPEEEVKLAFKVFRDMFVFTNHRLILIDKQGMTGKKVEYNSIPYKSITHFSVETAGSFDRDSEIKIWIKGHFIGRELKKGVDIIGLQRTLAYYVLGNH